MAITDKGTIAFISANKIKTTHYNQFQGFNFDTQKKEVITKGIIYFKNNQTLSIFIETGKPSMVIIYAINTLQKIYS